MSDLHSFLKFFLVIFFCFEAFGQSSDRAIPEPDNAYSIRLQIVFPTGTRPNPEDEDAGDFMDIIQFRPVNIQNKSSDRLYQDSELFDFLIYSVRGELQGEFRGELLDGPIDSNIKIIRVLGAYQEIKFEFSYNTNMDDLIDTENNSNVVITMGSEYGREMSLRLIEPQKIDSCGDVL